METAATQHEAVSISLHPESNSLVTALRTQQHSGIAQASTSAMVCIKMPLLYNIEHLSITIIDTKTHKIQDKKSVRLLTNNAAVQLYALIPRHTKVELIILALCPSLGKKL